VEDEPADTATAIETIYIRSFMSDVLLDKLHELKSDLGGWRDRQERLNKAMQKQLDAIDSAGVTRHAGGSVREFKSILEENEDVARLLRDHKGVAYVSLKGDDCRHFETKTTMTESAAGFTVSGVMGIDRIVGITPEARQRLTIRGVLPARPTDMAVVDFVKVLSPPGPASPQVEASDKNESAGTFESVSEKVRTLAIWQPASKQILDDLTELAGYLQTALPYYVNLLEEQQLLAGDGTGENLHGFISQATAFDHSLLSGTAGWNYIDQIGRAIEQIVSSKEIEPTFAIINPREYWSMRLAKSTFGTYLMGDPQAVVAPSLFGLSLVPTTSITPGTFLVGSGNPVACEIRDRMEMQLEISTQHSDFWVKNLVAIRAEKRLALIVKRPASYCTGSFSTSPSL
jgi:HK97 family phage major capsid protein